MNFNPITLADSAATNTAANGPQSMILMIVWLAVIFGAMYFIMIRPQRKKQKEEKKMPNFANTLHTAILVFVRLPFEFDNNLL